MMYLGRILEGPSDEESNKVPAPFPPASVFSCSTPRVASLMQGQRLWKKEQNQGREVVSKVLNHWEQVLRIQSLKGNNVEVQDEKKNSFEGQRFTLSCFSLRCAHRWQRSINILAPSSAEIQSLLSAGSLPPLVFYHIIIIIES